MNKGSRLVELRPNRLLLDASFGGYKLSLEPVPIYRKTLDTGVEVKQPSDDQFSFCHIKMFTFHNHLHVNPFKPNSVYFIDKNWRVLKVISSPPNQALAFREVLQIPKVQQQGPGSYNLSIAFPLSQMVVISDGSGAHYLAKILSQDNDEIWEFLHSDTLFREEVNSIVSDARIECLDNERTLHVLLLYIEEKRNENNNAKGGLFQTKLKWRTFFEKNNTWEKKSYKELCINGSVDYVALAPGCKSLYIVSDKSPKWVSDSENSLPNDTEMEVEPNQEPKLFTWTQTNEEITLWMPVSQGTTKADIVISVDDLQIEIKVKGETVLSGKFFHRVSKDLTTWIFEKGRVEIQLTKHESGLMWKTLFPDAHQGEEILNPEFVENVHEKLAHLCSDTQETSSTPTFNNFQLEECDAVSCDTTSLFRINGDTHLTTHEVSLSSLQWLFKVSCDPSQTDGICVRHDVDACVWQFSEPEDESTWPHEHVGTFSAFGYVQASKTQKKFIATPSDLSYVAILDASHHIYIYRQPSPLASELKNRHTGKKVDTISKQQLVNLETKDQILGAHATNNLLFVLLENSICVLAVNA